VLKKAEEITIFNIENIIPFEYEQQLEFKKIELKKLKGKINESTVIIKVTEEQLINGIEEVEENGNDKTEE